MNELKSGIKEGDLVKITIGANHIMTKAYEIIKDKISLAVQVHNGHKPEIILTEIETLKNEIPGCILEVVT